MADKNFGMITSMDEYGGSFIKALAECLLRADGTNYDKLEKAFPEYFKEYSDLAEARAENS